MNEAIDIGGMLAEQVRRLFAARVDREAWVRAEREGIDPALWDEIEAMGLTLALCPEEHGGAGLGWAGIEPSLRALGEHAAPLPLGETAIAAWLLARAGIEVPGGVIALADAVFRIEPDGRVSGHDPLVHWLPVAGHVVLLAERGDTRQLCLLRREPGTGTPVTTLDRLPAATLSLDHAEAVAVGAADGFDALGLRPYLAALRGIQMAGALAHVLALCVEYANDRVQFGKPIGKFQAIQQMIAELAGQAAAAQVAGLYAARQIDAGNAAYGAAVAKSVVGRHAGRGAAIAHQVFGAIGVTDEHSLHYYTRRLWQWRADAGSEHAWSEYLGHQALAQEGAALWQRLTTPAAAIATA